MSRSFCFLLRTYIQKLRLTWVGYFLLVSNQNKGLGLTCHSVSVISIFNKYICIFRYLRYLKSLELGKLCMFLSQFKYEFSLYLFKNIHFTRRKSNKVNIFSGIPMIFTTNCIGHSLCIQNTNLLLGLTLHKQSDKRILISLISIL